MSNFNENVVVVCKHPAQIEWITKWLGNATYIPDQGKILLWDSYLDDSCEYCDYIPVQTENVTPEDVEDKVVYGNLPLLLASLASEVRAIQFRENPPRGLEYTVDQMDASGAFMASFTVEGVELDIQEVA